MVTPSRLGSLFQLSPALIIMSRMAVGDHFCVLGFRKGEGWADRTQEGRAWASISLHPDTTRSESIHKQRTLICARVLPCTKVASCCSTSAGLHSMPVVLLVPMEMLGLWVCGNCGVDVCGRRPCGFVEIVVWMCVGGGWGGGMRMGEWGKARGQAFLRPCGHGHHSRHLGAGPTVPRKGLRRALQPQGVALCPP